MSVVIEKGQHWTDTREVGGKVVTLTTVAQEELEFDDQFYEGLFVQAAKDGKEFYRWDFGSGDILYMSVK